jgi:transcriptional regulator with XRE-family HTH domain
MSRRGLSLRAGLAQAVVGQIERGDVEEPVTSTLVALADALDVPLDWLATGRGDDPLATDAA